jgi:hypothetical protein
MSFSPEFLTYYFLALTHQEDRAYSVFFRAMLESNPSAWWGSAGKAGALSPRFLFNFPGEPKALNSRAKPQIF